MVQPAWVAFASAFFTGRPVAGAVIGAIFGFGWSKPVLGAARVRNRRRCAPWRAVSNGYDRTL
jgi:hypothetical protein